jgi:lipopolysaccharide/colanic/teichoic acid biosynthesis glycosyltransferase
MPVYNYYKRCFDIVFSSAMIVFCAPVMILVAMLIRLKMGKGVFFNQTRPGLHGTPFKMIKFRTMRNATDNQGNILPDEKRLTSLGSFLRKTSLDELPEFFNVLKGDMSIVGPRPLLMSYLNRYTSEQMRRHNVKPGITGWAQINGRNAISWKKKFELDVWYVDHKSFALDIHIVMRTIIKTFVRADIQHEGCATMEEFRGNQESVQ